MFKMPFTPNRDGTGAQALFIEDAKHRHVAFVSGWRGGKTWAGARKFAMLHVMNSFGLDGKRTGCWGLCVAQTFTVGETVMIPELQVALGQLGIDCHYRGQPHYVLETAKLSSRQRPSRILLRSAEHPETISGFEVGHGWRDEPARFPVIGNRIDQSAMVQSDGRLSDGKARRVQMLDTFTHEGDMTQVYDMYVNTQRDDRALYSGTTHDNAHHLNADYIRDIEDMPHDLAQQYIYGRAVSYHGNRVYGSFDERRNVDPGLRLVWGAPIHLSLDFNSNPGMHGVVGQRDPATGVITAVYEIHERGMSVEGAIKAFAAIIQATGGWKYEALHLFGDASGRSKWAGNQESCWQVAKEFLDRLGFSNYHMKVPMSNPAIADRVNSMNMAMMSASGKVSYKIHPRCKILIGDFRRMKWMDGEIDKRERTLSHASDAEGYRANYIAPIRPMKFLGAAASGGIGFSRAG